MKRFAVAALTLTLVAVAATSSQAQQRGPGGRGGFGMGGPAILGIPTVQDELKLTDEQRGKVETMMTGLREEMTGLRDKLSDVAPEERFARMREMMEEANAKVRKDVAAMLDSDQMKRFEQLELQVRGLDAFADAKVQEALKVAEEQKTKIGALMTEMAEKRQSIMQEAQGDFQGAMTKFRELQDSTREKVMALMSDDQKAKYKELIGEPFEMPAFGGGRGPGAGAGGGRRPIDN